MLGGNLRKREEECSRHDEAETTEAIEYGLVSADPREAEGAERVLAGV